MTTGMVMVRRGGGGGGVGERSSHGGSSKEQNRHQQQQLSLLDFLMETLRKSMVSCRVNREEDVISTIHRAMEIGWPTDVQHITHVTFDRFQGFLGLPVEFEVEIPCRVPSASISVFGVSAESMQCSYDNRGNSVPTILLLMQERLYSQGGLKAEGIFRINPENSREEHVRDQLNRGIVAVDIDVHCLAGLIKAWFRELPSGVLDGLSPEQVLQCNTEEQFVELVKKQLKPTETALLNWAIDLMADIVEHEESNKMHSRNIAMVFAPNMTQMSDPLTALMHAVQVMNLLKTLITKTLRERGGESSSAGGYSPMSSHSSDDGDECDTQEEEEEQEEEDEEEEDEEEEEEEELLLDSGCKSEEEDEEHGDYNSTEDRCEVESWSKIEEHCFLRQQQLVQGILCRDPPPPLMCNSPVSFSDSKVDSSGLSTSEDGDESRASS
ncbi:unnamed protein product [Cuscuta campestris]|uniref:Rho-GAP domain-containing protein n=1 Tax=Cuscuta campestris TaxID=132261 RepID=A0A484LRA8_9ASTE|nr:unnamed protein product [Cuscuta campestris]